MAAFRESLSSKTDAQLVSLRRVFRQDLPLYPAGTRTRQELAERIRAIDLELESRKGGDPVSEYTDQEIDEATSDLSDADDSEDT